MQPSELEKLRVEAIVKLAALLKGRLAQIAVDDIIAEENTARKLRVKHAADKKPSRLSNKKA